ncbi:MAG: hypothetical protein ACOCWS_00425 [Alkalispirochaetaceae bacterium]
MVQRGRSTDLPVCRGLNAPGVVPEFGLWGYRAPGSRGVDTLAALRP